MKFASPHHYVGGYRNNLSSRRYSRESRSRGDYETLLGFVDKAFVHPRAVGLDIERFEPYRAAISVNLYPRRLSWLPLRYRTGNRRLKKRFYLVGWHRLKLMVGFHFSDRFSDGGVEQLRPERAEKLFVVID